MALNSTELREVDAEDVEHVHVHKGGQFSCNSACSFSNKEQLQSDAAHRTKTLIKLWGLIIFCTLVMMVEIFGGLKANSLAILTDAAHVFSDIAGFAISLFTVWVSGWEATTEQSFGYNRLEVLGAFVSVQLIWIVSAVLMYEAINRLVTKATIVDGTLMFAVAAFGFVVNIIMVAWLGHDHSSHHCHSHDSCKNNIHEHEGEVLCIEIDGAESTKLVSAADHQKTEKLNINIQGAYLHLITDLIQSTGVMIAGSIIWLKPEWRVIDLICTIIFSAISLTTTLPMLKNIFSILMERAPSEIDTASLANGLKRIGGVCDVHDLHVWAITVGKYVVSCHVKIETGGCPNDILHTIRTYCEQQFGIHHVTVQIEQEL